VNSFRTVFLERSLQGFLDDAASTRTVPASGVTAALVGALGAAMGEMAVGMTARRELGPAQRRELRSDARDLINIKERFTALMTRDAAAVRRWIDAGLQPQDEEMMACSREAVELSLRLVEHINDFYPRCMPALRHEALTAAMLAEAVARIARSSLELSPPLEENGDAGDDASLVGEQIGRISALVRLLEEPS
jgi:hypothetical protein